MKKVLFATTALIATAGIAAADVSLSGAANATLINDGVSGNDTMLQTSVELDVAFSGATDNGYTFGASMDINTGADAADPEIFITGDFGTLTFGDVSDATDSIGVTDVGEHGIGVHNALEGLMNGPAADVSYSYAIEGLTLTLSTTVGGSTAAKDDGEGDFAAHVSYTMNGFRIEVASGHDDSEGDDNLGLEFGYTLGDLTLAAAYASKDFADASDRDLSGMGISAAYKINDALSITGVYASTEKGAAGTPDQDDYGIGFSYSLGGGATIAGGMGEVANVDKWDLGIAMKF
jgi:outer membrane protein OmpU